MATLPFSLSDILSRSRSRGDPERVIRLREKARETVKKSSILEELGDKLLAPREIEEKPMELYYETPFFEKDAFSSYMIVQNYQMVYKAIKDRLVKNGVYVGSTDEAVKRFDRLKGKLFASREDYFSDPIKALHVALRSGGTLVYVPAGLKVTMPIHALFTITRSLVSQTEHTVLIAEPGASFNYIEGCVADIKIEYALHLGALEAFVGKNASIKVASLVSRSSNVDHRPIKGGLVEENGELDMTAIFLRGSSYTAGPEVKLKQNARASLATYALYRGVKALSRPKIILEAPGASGLIVNRTVLVDKAREDFVGTLLARRGARKAKGHMVCDALLLSDDVVSVTTPALHAEENDVSLTHEASVGKISEDVLFYLGTCGIDEDEAVSLVIRGYLDPATEGLPLDIALSIKKAIEAALKGEYRVF